MRRRPDERARDRLAPLRRSLSLRARYLTAIALVATLGLAQFLIVFATIYNQRLVAAVIDTAERQRFIVAAINLHASEIVGHSSPGSRVQRRALLLEAAAQLEENEHQLTDPNSASNPVGWPPSSVRTIFYGPQHLDEHVVDLIAHARLFADVVGDRSPQSGSLDELRRESDLVLAGYDDAISAYLADASLRETELLRIEVVAFVAMLLTLGIILLAIFVPMERRIERQQRDLLDENDRLTAVVVESQALLAMVPVAELVGRFVDGASKLLRTDVHWVADPTLPTYTGTTTQPLAELPDTARHLVRNAVARHEFTSNKAGDALAIAIPIPPSEESVTCFAARRVPFGVAETTALSLYSNILTLSARNAKLYNDLQEREARVAELDKFKSDLIAMLAHDFRGPLTTIIGYAEMIGDGSADGDELAQMAATIGANAWRLANFATDTLTMSQLERNEITLDVAEIDVGELARDAASGHRNVAVVVPSEPLTIECDSKRLRQVFENLIGNAVKYSGGGTKTVTVTVAPERAGAAVAIADQGIGIPAEELEAVFSRFARASNARKAGIKGTGFGLYLSRMIVQLHGGTITVSSIEGEGSTFIIALPRKPPRA